MFSCLQVKFSLGRKTREKNERDNLPRARCCYVRRKNLMTLWVSRSETPSPIYCSSYLLWNREREECSWWAKNKERIFSRLSGKLIRKTLAGECHTRREKTTESGEWHFYIFPLTQMMSIREKNEARMINWHSTRTVCPIEVAEQYMATDTELLP